MLHACPWCGKKAEMVEEDGRFGATYYQAKCADKLCQGRLDWEHTSRELAEGHWNRRSVKTSDELLSDIDEWHSQNVRDLSPELSSSLSGVVEKYRRG